MWASFICYAGNFYLKTHHLGPWGVPFSCPPPCSLSGLLILRYYVSWMNFPVFFSLSSPSPGISSLLDSQFFYELASVFAIIVLSSLKSPLIFGKASVITCSGRWFTFSSFPAWPLCFGVYFFRGFPHTLVILGYWPLVWRIQTPCGQ